MNPRLTKLRILTHVSLLAMALCVAAPTAQAAVVTRIQDAFTDANWSLWWNGDGPLGDPAAYNPQFSIPHPGQGQQGQPFYAALVNDPYWLSTSNNVDQGYVGVFGGNPGPGYSSIFKYTVQTAGTFVVQNSSFTSVYPSVDGMEALIYLNNSATPFASALLPAGQANASVSLDMSLGDLAAGDSIYFVMSPGGNNFADQFAIQLEIAAIPEPGTIALVLGAGLLFVLVRARKTSVRS